MYTLKRVNDYKQFKVVNFPDVKNLGLFDKSESISTKEHEVSKSNTILISIIRSNMIVQK